MDTHRRRSNTALAHQFAERETKALVVARRGRIVLELYAWTVKGIT